MDEPDFSLGGLSIWVEGRHIPDAAHYLDRNWLQVRATMRSAQASVTTDGPILLTKDFDRFRAELVAMNETLTGSATLWSYEPNLKVTLSTDGLVGGKVEITPDQLSESHWFCVEGFDQTGLPEIIASPDALMERFPVEDWPEA